MLAVYQNPNGSNNADYEHISQVDVYYCAHYRIPIAAIDQVWGKQRRKQAEMLKM